MAQSHDFICDLTGEVIKLAPLPIVVRIQVAVVPGALVDPRPEDLPAFFHAMLVHPDGSPRPGVVELGAAAFLRHVQLDVEALRPAFAGPPEDADQVAPLKSALEQAQEALRVLRAEYHDLEHRTARQEPRAEPVPRG